LPLYPECYQNSCHSRQSWGAKQLFHCLVLQTACAQQLLALPAYKSSMFMPSYPLPVDLHHLGLVACRCAICKNLQHLCASQPCTPSRVVSGSSFCFKLCLIASRFAELWHYGWCYSRHVQSDILFATPWPALRSMGICIMTARMLPTCKNHLSMRCPCACPFDVTSGESVSLQMLENNFWLATSLARILLKCTANSSFYQTCPKMPQTTPQERVHPVKRCISV